MYCWIDLISILPCPSIYRLTQDMSYAYVTVGQRDKQGCALTAALSIFRHTQNHPFAGFSFLKSIPISDQLIHPSTTLLNLSTHLHHSHGSPPFAPRLHFEARAPAVLRVQSGTKDPLLYYWRSVWRLRHRAWSSKVRHPEPPLRRRRHG